MDKNKKIFRPTDSNFFGLRGNSSYDNIYIRYVYNFSDIHRGMNAKGLMQN